MDNTPPPFSLDDLKRHEQIRPVATITWLDKPVKFHVPTSHAYWRVENFTTLEPETLRWIAAFKPGEILIDIGANVGTYTVAAAVGPEVEVYAFEPESLNYALLNRNIVENGIGDLVNAYCLALSDETGLDDLYLSGFMDAGSCHSFGEKVDFRLEPTNPTHKQGSVSFRLDDLIEKTKIPVPDHIKIDVDGIEHKVIGGAVKTLANPKVQSVLIELNVNLEIHRDLISQIENMGFTIDQTEIDEAMCNEGTFKGVGNHIFRR